MPKKLDNFKAQFPDLWSAYERLRNESDRVGPLDGKTVELIKIGISTAMEHEGGIVAHASQARKAGASDEEIYQAILTAISLCGFPAVLGAVSTAKEFLEP